MSYHAGMAMARARSLEARGAHPSFEQTRIARSINAVCTRVKGYVDQTYPVVQSGLRRRRMGLDWVEPSTRPFRVLEGNVEVSGDQMIGPVQILRAKFPDNIQVGLSLIEFGTRLEYARYDEGTFVDWSPTPPTDNFYLDRIHAVWPDIDLRAPRQEETGMWRPKEKAAVNHLVHRVEALRDEGFLADRYTTTVGDEGSFRVTDARERVVAESIATIGQDGLPHQEYRYTHYNGDSQIEFQASLTNVNEPNRTLSVTYAEPNSEVTPVPWRSLRRGAKNWADGYLR